MKYTDPDKYCTICSEKGIEYHHIYTQAAHPDLADSVFNKVPLCRAHHTMWHMKGTRLMAQTYREVRQWLTSHQWQLTEYMGRKKWMHDKEPTSLYFTENSREHLEYKEDPDKYVSARKTKKEAL